MSGKRRIWGMRLAKGNRRKDSFLFTNTVMARSLVMLPCTTFRPIAKPLMLSLRSN